MINFTELLDKMTALVADTTELFKYEKLVTGEDEDVQDFKNQYSWHLNIKTGEYFWLEKNKKHKGHKNIGSYKVIHNKANNTIEAYFEDSTETIEIINLETIYDSEGFVGYVEDRAAKFAMIAAESGGLPAKTETPIYDALIISASMTNRQYVEMLKRETPFSTDASRLRFGIGSIQSLFHGQQYQAYEYQAYQNYEYGQYKRFRGNVFGENMGLTTIYNALDHPRRKLLENYNLKDAFYILSYAHKPSGSSGLLEVFDIEFNSTLAPYMAHVQGSNYWLPKE
ncbi:MAG: hypothetical protein JXL97_13820 [Bacteroidales bacterium]|nr:hypothetical protein [Bacteroidales bacterium]